MHYCNVQYVYLLMNSFLFIVSFWMLKELQLKYIIIYYYIISFNCITTVNKNYNICYHERSRMLDFQVKRNIAL